MLKSEDIKVIKCFGKVASLLCWADPAVFEPEAEHKLHGDIEYYYKLFCVNHNHGSCADNPTWEIEIYQPTEGFWDNEDENHLKLIQERTDLSELLRQYPSREKARKTAKKVAK